MKIRYLLLALFLSGPFLMRAQCPRIAGIMVDACGTGATENTNEFIFLLNGNAPLNVDDLVIGLPANGSISLANTNDFAPNTGSSPVGACLTVLDDGAVIPANAPFIIFMSNNVQTAYDFTSWCTQYGTVYLLYRNLASPTTATFLNESNVPVTRTVTLAVNGSPACSASYIRNVQVGTNVSVDGNFYRWPDPVGGVSNSPGFVNNGCASPPFQLLPVTLSSFTASYQNPGVMLNWTTAMELNASYFEVLRSNDGMNYSVIGTVSAMGNSGSLIQYSYTDSGPLDGRTYYRLRTVDLDGSSSFSKIVSVRAGTAGVILNNLYPNPVSDELIVEWNGSNNMKTQVSIRDVNGRLLQTTTVNSVRGFNQLRLNTSQLSSGQYFLSLDVEKDNIVEVFLKR